MSLGAAIDQGRIRISPCLCHRRGCVSLSLLNLHCKHRPALNCKTAIEQSVPAQKAQADLTWPCLALLGVAWCCLVLQQWPRPGSRRRTAWKLLFAGDKFMSSTAEALVWRSDSRMLLGLARYPGNPHRLARLVLKPARPRLPFPAGFESVPGVVCRRYQRPKTRERQAPSANAGRSGLRGGRAVLVGAVATEPAGSIRDCGNSIMINHRPGRTQAQRFFPFRPRPNQETNQDWLIDR